MSVMENWSGAPEHARRRTRQTQDTQGSRACTSDDYIYLERHKILSRHKWTVREGLGNGDSHLRPQASGIARMYE